MRSISERAQAGRAISVLLVEDDTDQCGLYMEELGNDGYVVRAAHDGWEALKLCDEEMPDIVVTDINMPGMDGIDAMERMFGKDYRLPVILFTSYEGYRENYRSASADAHLIKSPDLTELRRTIRRVLENRRRVTKASA